MKTTHNFLLLLTFAQLLMVCSASYAAHSVIHEGRLVSSIDKPYDSYPVMDDYMVYQKKKTEKYTAGYRPSNFFKIKGAVTKSVYDFARDYSSVGVFQRFKTELVNQNFDILYECHNSECGPLLGWKLYLDKQIGGDPQTQFYLAAKKTETVDEKIQHATVHVSEIDQQPRMVLHTIKRLAHSDIYDEYTAKRIALDGNLNKVFDFYFDTANANVPKYQKEQLQKTAQTILNLAEHKEILLVGYADTQGQTKANKKLSFSRAKHIQTLLSTEFGITKNKMIVRAGGELEVPQEQNDKARKVSVYIIN